MSPRLANVIAPIVLVIAGAPIATAKAKPPTAPAVQYEKPIGGQFLVEWSPHLARHIDGPAVLFLLSAAELNSARYSWEMPSLAKSMAEELLAVLDEGCRAGCGPQVGPVRARLQELLDAQRQDGVPRTRRWQTGHDAPPIEDHRSIAIRTRAGQITLDVSCSCVSSTIGMRHYNDVTTCDASLLDRGRFVLRYAPRTDLASGKIALLSELDAYTQTVTFADGEALEIKSGYEYSGNGADTPRQKAGVRGSLRWFKVR
jgi:hypothetical protein